MNDAIATAGSNALVLDTQEQKLGREASLYEKQAMSLVIASDDDFAVAGEVSQAVKRMQKTITEYWEPLRVSTKDAYDRVLSQKKEMLDPLKNAEAILKSKMGDYSRMVEENRRRQEEEMRRLAQAETERKLAEAAECEANGDAVGAAFAMAQAEAVDNMVFVPTAAPKPKAKGVSQSKSWEITSIDASKVPVDLNGMVIRPVDEKAVLSLIKASKGKIIIPGIEYKETIVTSIRT